MVTGQREQRLVFGEVADLYDRYRPGYAAAVFQRLVAYGSLRPGDRALEVGCGTGRATLLLAALNLHLTALEPSPEMAAVARRRTQSLTGLEVVEAAFEDWTLPTEPFRLVASAQAWHWVNPAVRLRKAHRALAPGGTLAVFWNTPGPSEEGKEIEADLDALYQSQAPAIAGSLRREVLADERRLEIADSGLFGAAVAEAFPWATTYSTEQYVDLLRTQSDHRLLASRVRERLLTGVAQVLDQHGGAYRQHYTTDLYLAGRPA
ncbi:MAG: class I SAM-dependent methyltransferase [Candidatus Dormibacteria bacterium]